ncbi:MAG: SPOR domain-containing protein [Bacteroidota bacterium]|nr:SPOR domain-containing protein [Bacteroidota bacterium]
MKLKHTTNTLFIMLLFALSINHLTAQTSIEGNSKFDNLLNEKKKINSSITTTDKYKIQIFYGDGQNARKVLNEFKQNFKNIDGTIIFSSPNYKVQVGNFKTKIEADRVRLDILKKYPDALVVRPSRK